MAITSGTYYVGPSETLVDWLAAAAEITNVTFTGDIVFIQRGDISQSAICNLSQMRQGPYDLTLTSAIAHKGDPNQGDKTTFSSSSCFRTTSDSTSSGGKIRIKDLYLVSANSGVNGIRNGSTSAFFVVTECLFNLTNSTGGESFFLDSLSCNVEMYNCKIWGFNVCAYRCNTGGPGAILKLENLSIWNNVADCIVIANGSASANRWVRNCVAYITTSSFGSGLFQTSSVAQSNNASKDASAAGSGSLTSITAAVFKSLVQTSPDFMNLADSSILKDAGITPQIAGNDHGIRGVSSTNPRPHSTGLVSIGADEISVPDTTVYTNTASSPWKGKSAPLSKVQEAKEFSPATDLGNSSSGRDKGGEAKEAKEFVPTTKQGDASPVQNSQNTTKEAAPYTIKGKPGQRNGFISLMAETKGYGAVSQTLATGYRMPFFSESLQMQNAFRDLDVVGTSRANIRRRALYPTPQGKAEFAFRSNDVIPLLQSHFQRRIGTRTAIGTTFYEFVPSLGRVDVFGSGWGTGSFQSAGSCEAFSLSVFKEYAGSGIIFKSGITKGLTFKFNALLEPSVEAEIMFREGTVMATSAAQPYGTYSTLPHFAPSSCSVSFLGFPVIDLEINSEANIEMRNVVGDSRPIHKFGQHKVSGKIVADLSQDRANLFGSALSGSGFALSATLFNSPKDQIIFDMPNCTLTEYPVGYYDIFTIPFQAWASEDGSTAPIKVSVWTQNYSATTFQPN